jgi:TolB-like protein/tetratricopeptide (TPR) repeat protein
MSGEAGRANPRPPPVDRLSLLWRRINDHKIVQWTVAYIAVAYGLQHGVILASESLEWPSAVARISILLLALGLPLVVTFAWYHGARASRNFSQAELSILAALLVMSSLLFYVFVRPEGQVHSSVAQEASVTAARQAAASPKGAISVAVLPFLDLSPAKDQEFFSDGMTEEITAALAKVPDMRVVARTSAFEFKGKNVDVEKIGQQLHATHLIEGSVRKAGNRLRITAQLIRADDGTHIWAEDYDRELTDVFAIQEDIARAITASLHRTLGLKPGENLVKNRNIDPESYQLYLHAQALWEGRGLTNFTDAARLLEQIVARNPNYAPAEALLCASYLSSANDRVRFDDNPIDERRTVDELLQKGEGACRLAVKLDPNSSVAYAASGSLVWSRGKPLEGEALFLKALALDPNDSDVLSGYGIKLALAGRLKEALAMMLKSHALDPFDPQKAANAARLLWLNGQNDEAVNLAKTLRPIDRAPRLAQIYASIGRLGDAADALMEITSGAPDSDSVREAVRLLRIAQAHDVLPQSLPNLPAQLDFVYLHVGAPDRVLDRLERAVEVGWFPGGTERVWHPAYSAVRKTERFKALIRKTGLVDYWRAKGWPDFCHSTTGDDFVCN